MITQTILVALAGSAAGVYLLFRAWRTWAGTKAGGCAGGCGCAATKKAEPGGLIRAEDLLSRVRERQAAPTPDSAALHSAEKK